MFSRHDLFTDKKSERNPRLHTLPVLVAQSSSPTTRVRSRWMFSRPAAIAHPALVNATSVTRRSPVRSAPGLCHLASRTLTFCCFPCIGPSLRLCTRRLWIVLLHTFICFYGGGLRRYFVGGPQDSVEPAAFLTVKVPRARVLRDSQPAHCQLACCPLRTVCACSVVPNQWLSAMLYMVYCLFGLFVLQASTYVSVSWSVCLFVSLGDRPSVLVCPALSAASHALEAVSAPLRGCKM